VKDRPVSELVRCTTQPHQGTDTLKHRVISESVRCTTQPLQWTDSLKHRLIIELMCWSIDLLGNWYSEAETLQRTNSMHHRTSLSNWFADAQARHRTGQRNTDASTNSFRDAHARHRTNSRMHNLVSELIQCSTQSSPNWFPRPHNLVRELIYRRRDSLVN